MPHTEQNLACEEHGVRVPYVCLACRTGKNAWERHLQRLETEARVLEARRVIGAAYMKWYQEGRNNS
jgi:hypothetical protein